jgi:hypothetical protein
MAKVEYKRGATMDFIEQLEILASRIRKQQDIIKTEEATKMAFVIPFITALGYDAFDPTEVIPEFVADVGEKQGEKVDYAILKENRVIMLIECKKCGVELGDQIPSQLFRYFQVTETRVAILTNGIIYRFYADLEKPNIMDQKPFMEFDILDIQEPLVHELKLFTKPDFDDEIIITVASDLKYTKEIKRIMLEQLETPSEDFVLFVLSRVYAGVKTKIIKEQFIDITKRALNQFLSEQINKRLKAVLAGEVSPSKNASEKTDVSSDENISPIVTTEEELEGFFIVRSILHEVIDPDRITRRDTLNYFGILLDNTSHKPICRLYFNRPQKYVSLFGEDKREEKVPISKLNDIYGLSDQLKATVAYYESLKKSDTTINIDADDANANWLHGKKV